MRTKLDKGSQGEQPDPNKVHSPSTHTCTQHVRAHTHTMRQAKMPMLNKNRDQLEPCEAPPCSPSPIGCLLGGTTSCCSPHGDLGPWDNQGLLFLFIGH